MPHSEPPNSRAPSRRRRAAPAGAPVQPVATAAAAAPAWAAPALWGALALLLAVRLVAPLAPGMWLWSVNVSRFLSPAAAWLPWGAALLGCAAALFPGPRAALARALEAADSRRGFVAATLAAALALAVWSLPDRLHFTGDFVLREGAISAERDPGRLFPQAMPLDVALHYHLPRHLGAKYRIEPNTTGRLLGAAEAGLLALLGCAFAWSLGARGAAALAAGACVVAGGALGLLTGYDKAFTELTLATLALGAAGVHALRSGRAILLPGLAVVLAVAVHRSGIALAPGLLACWGLWLLRHGRSRALAPSTLLGVLAPAAALAALAPRVVHGIRVLDARHLNPEGVRHAGWLAATFGEGRALDLANVVVLLAPLAPLLPVVALAAGPRAARRPEVLFLGALALPLLAVLVAVHPIQGEFRDWDVFAPSGIAIAMLVAALLATVIEGSRGPALALALALSAAVPALQWLLHLHDERRGLARVDAYVSGPPPRSAPATALAWEFVAMHHFRELRWDDAARACARAVEFSPNPRFYLQWGMAEAMRGDWARAQKLYREAVERNPDFTMAWVALASASSMLNDVPETVRAAERVRRLDPRNDKLPEIDTYLARMRAAGLAPPLEPGGSGR